MRRTVQGIVLILFLFLILITRYPFHELLPVDLFLVLDPLLALTASLASGQLVPGWFFALGIIVLTMVLGRFFCGWFCPLGTCIDLSEEAVYRKRKRRWPNDSLRYRNIKLYILAFLIAAALLGHSFAYLVDPISLATRLFTYALVPTASFAGNLFLDGVRPLAERMEWYDLARAHFRPQLYSSPAVFTVLFFAFIIALSALQPRFWCRSVCPLGGLFSLTARVPFFRRRVAEGCDHKGVCTALCETGAIAKEREEGYRPGECILCMKCITKCTQKVATFSPGGKIEKEGTDPGRRKVLAGAASGAAAAFFLNLSPGAVLRDENLLRPPGALPEKEFLETCVRCGQCIKACPTNTLHPAMGTGGMAGLFAPLHHMRLSGCDQDCNLCGQVCPTQAIRDLDLDQRRYAKIGTARILPHRCVVWLSGLKCLVCDEACPYGAVYWKEENDVRKPYVDEKRCNGCGICEGVCPVGGESAIVIGPHGEIRLSEGSYVEEADSRGLTLVPKKERGEYY